MGRNLSVDFLGSSICAPILHRMSFPEDRGASGWSASYGGGIYNDEKYLKIGVTRFGKESLIVDAPKSVVANDFEDIAIFGGYMFAHWGHFLLETASRLWAKEFFPDIPIVFIKHDKYSVLYQQQIDFLSQFGRVILVGESAVRFNKLLLPTPSFELGGEIAPDAYNYIKEVFSSVKSNPVASFIGKKIYLSRLAIKKRSVSNELELIQFLNSAGFICVNIEDLSLFEQVKLFNEADVIVSAFGSAWHNLVVSKSRALRIYLNDSGDLLHDYRDYASIEKISLGSHIVLKCMFPAVGHEDKNLWDRNYVYDLDLIKSAIADILV